MRVKVWVWASGGVGEVWEGDMRLWWSFPSPKTVTPYVCRAVCWSRGLGGMGCGHVMVRMGCGALW